MPSPAAAMAESTTKQYTAKYLYLRLLGYAWKHRLVFLLGIPAMAVLSATNTGFHALPLLLFALMVVRAVAGFTSNFSMRWVSRRMVEQLRLDAFRRLMTLPISFFDGHYAKLYHKQFH